MLLANSLAIAETHVFYIINQQKTQTNKIDFFHCIFQLIQLNKQKNEQKQ